MSLYTDIKSILADIKTLSAKVKNGPVLEQLAALQQRVLGMMEKAVEAERRHADEMDHLKADHAAAVAELERRHAAVVALLAEENAQLKLQQERQQNSGIQHRSSGNYGGNRLLDF